MDAKEEDSCVSGMGKAAGGREVGQTAQGPAGTYKQSVDHLRLVIPVRHDLLDSSFHILHDHRAACYLEGILCVCTRHVIMHHLAYTHILTCNLYLS